MKKIVILTIIMATLSMALGSLARYADNVYANPTAGVSSVLNDAVAYPELGSVSSPVAGVPATMANAMDNAIEYVNSEEYKEEMKKQEAKEKRQKAIRKAKKNIVALYTKGNTNVRAKASTGSAIVTMLPYNTEVTGWVFEDWLHTEDGCIYANLLSKDRVPYRSIAAPWSSGVKSWMPYTTITDRSTKQYTLQHSYAYTGTYGIRQVNGRYCVALGTYWGIAVGQYFDMVLENNTIISCIMADVKANQHTDGANVITVANGCMSEFVVDRWALDSKARQSGYINSCTPEWDSRIVEIRAYDENIFN